ncbi:MAG: 6-phosphogluconolactonase [Parachlamydiales bacterium]|nr:6-phosphogluconolactonase [Parachlamydiales bacterium]
MKKIQKFENQNDLNTFLVDFFIKKSTDEIVEKKGYFTVAISGGKTPLSFLAILAKEPKILWDKIFLFFVDERMLENTSEVSNIYQINKYLIHPLKLKNVFYINKDIDDKDAALEYELQIKAILKQEKPSFDLVLLGIGKDGHTASIFPESEIFHQKEKLVDVTQKKEESFSRISMTLPLINNSKNIAFIAVGDNKAEIIKRILIDNDKKLPAANVHAKELLYFLLDKKAAKFL